MNTTLRLFVAAATAALLTACGGGSDPAPPAEPATTVPDSATASVRAYTEFTGRLIADADPMAAPLMLNAASAPTSESATPLPVP